MRPGSPVTVDPVRAARTPRAGSGTVITMHPRRTTFLLLSVLLTAGCVAVPHPPPPRPRPVPGGPAPAADRPPTPVPAWPVPAQPVPHEEIAHTEPLPGTPTGRPRRRPVAQGEAGAVEVPAAGRSPERRTATPPARRGSTAPRNAAKPAKATAGKTRTRTEPRAAMPSARGTSRPKAPSAARGGPQPTNAGTPAMRELCRQAQDIDAPMGAADLCRGMYGR
ncbi:hypothetical protein ABZY16_24225 [Streptomyces sp. NPDC006553]|uniref:hypothetical protein n=1 Tax=unclassified Streptomyces TaxID=2593676 RepID=UPI0022539E16|nr:hypothetical protein [Streptomyces sp. NBC_00233]MCX5231971.1 hypothetical protein [Streptomyces sp. NBC_00233]